MAYSSYTQFTYQFPLIDTSIVTEIAVTQFIKQADSEIDILLAKSGHDTPLSTVPDVVVGLSTFIAGRNAMLAAGVSEQGVITPEMWEQVIDEIERLEKLLLDLPLTSTETYHSPVSIGHKGLNTSVYSNFTLTDITAGNYSEDD